MAIVQSVSSTAYPVRNVEPPPEGTMLVPFSATLRPTDYTVSGSINIGTLVSQICAVAIDNSTNSQALTLVHGVDQHSTVVAAYSFALVPTSSYTGQYNWSASVPNAPSGNVSITLSFYNWDRPAEIATSTLIANATIQNATLDVAQSGAWSVSSVQSGTWNINAIQSGTWNVGQSGTWNINAVQSGAWNISAAQSGTWNMSQAAGAIWNVSSVQSGTWNVGQSGTWTVNAAQNGTWNISAAQSGTWNMSQAAGVIWNVSSVQSGTWNVGQSGTWTINASQSGTWNINAAQSGTWNMSQAAGVIWNVNSIQSGTWNVGQSGTWNINAVQSGTWNVGQSGSWAVSVSGTANVNITNSNINATIQNASINSEVINAKLPNDLSMNPQIPTYISRRSRMLKSAQYTFPAGKGTGLAKNLRRNRLLICCPITTTENVQIWLTSNATTIAMLNQYNPHVVIDDLPNAITIQNNTASTTCYINEMSDADFSFATTVGTPTYSGTGGVFGVAPIGETFQYVSFGAGTCFKNAYAPFEGTSTWTVELWVAIASIPSSEQDLWMLLLGDNFSNSGLVLYAAPTSGYAAFKFHNIKLGTIAVASTTNICDNVFHHLALVGTGATVDLYVDGTKQASGAYSLVLGEDNEHYWSYSGNIGSTILMQELAIWGYPRYTATFDVPQQPYSGLENNLLALYHASATDRGPGTTETATGLANVV